jgi:hypothetical protein
MMSPKQIEKALQRLHKLEKEMALLGPVMRGSVVRIGTRNKQFYFSLNKDKKTRLIYLGKERVDQARRLSGNYKKLLTLIEKMTLLNMDLLKNDALK